MAWWTRSGWKKRAGRWTRGEAKAAQSHGRANRERASIDAEVDENDLSDEEITAMWDKGVPAPIATSANCITYNLHYPPREQE